MDFPVSLGSDDASALLTGAQIHKDNHAGAPEANQRVTLKLKGQETVISRSATSISSTSSLRYSAEVPSNDRSSPTFRRGA